MTIEEYITCKDIAHALGISLSSATTLVRTGRIRGVNVSSSPGRATYRVSVSAFTEFLASQNQPKEPEKPAPTPGSLPRNIPRFV